MLSTNNGDVPMSENLKQTAVRFEPELYEKLQEMADRDRRPLASLIRKICHEAATATAAAERSHAA
jgi:predicted DNA-binding ribbon-helix-helix protein